MSKKQNQLAPQPGALQKLVLPLLPLVAITLLFEVLNQNGFISSYILPSPTEIFETLQLDFSEYTEAFSQTAIASIVGLVASIIAGILIALLLSLSKQIELAFYPYAIFFQTVPIIAIAPLLVIWFGFGLPTVAASSFIVSIFPILANTLSGMRAAPQNLVDLFSLYKATRLQSLIKLRLPYAVPQIIAGIRIASGLSLIGAIVGEFIAGGGLGGMVDIARTQQRIDKVFASILIVSFLGIIIVSCINITTRIFLKNWKEAL